MESSEKLISSESVEKNDPAAKYKFLGGAAIVGISGISAIIAGLVTSHVAKKKNKEYFMELQKTPLPPAALENAYSLAFRALAWGTVWAVGGCSLIAFGIWKWYGFKDFDDFRMRMRKNIKKSPPTDERTEFESVKDFINYLNETYKSEKNLKETKP